MTLGLASLGEQLSLPNQTTTDAHHRRPRLWPIMVRKRGHRPSKARPERRRMTSDFFHLHSTAQDALARLADTRPGQPVRVAVTARLATARHLLALEMESFLAEAGRRPRLSCCPAAETGRAASGRVPDGPAPCYLLVISDDRCPVGMAGHAANIVLLLDPQAA